MKFAVWLLPSKTDQKVFQSLVYLLSDQFRAPHFYPHLTLCGGCDLPLSEAESLLRGLAGCLSSFEVKTRAIKSSRLFFRSIAVDVKSCSALDKAYRECRRQFRPRSYRFKPHVSLLYSDCALSQKKRAAASLSVPETIIFDKIALCYPGDQKLLWRNVKRWRLRYCQKLSGK